MKEIKAYLRPNMVDPVVDALEARPEMPGLTVTTVTGYGHVKGEEGARLVERVKLEIVVPDEQAEATVQTIIEKARTGAPGDGKIFVTEVREAIRIRTGERGDEALSTPRA